MTPDTWLDCWYWHSGTPYLTPFYAYSVLRWRLSELYHQIKKSRQATLNTNWPLQARYNKTYSLRSLVFETGPVVYGSRNVSRCLKIHANNSQSFRTEQIWMWTMNDVVTVTPISRVIVVDCVQSALPTTMYQGRIPLVWGQSISCRQTSKRRLNIALASGPICLAFLLYFVDFRAVNVQLALCNIRLNKPLSWPTITP